MFRFFVKRHHTVDTGVPDSESGCFQISPAGRASIHPDGAVFLNVERGVIFKSNRVGSRIWQGIQNHESPAGIAARISREYAVPEELASQDTARFLAQLETEGFLTRKTTGDQV
jgi:hypothetical protein